MFGERVQYTRPRFCFQVKLYVLRLSVGELQITLDFLCRNVYFLSMDNENAENIQAWLQALHEENKHLNAQLKHMTAIIEAVGLHTASMKKDAETTRFRIGALCVCFIVIPVLLFLGFCSVSAGAAAGKIVKDQPTETRGR